MSAAFLGINNTSYSVTSRYMRSQSLGTVKEDSFSNALTAHEGTGVRATSHSTVDDYITNHPESKAQIDRLLNPGLSVIQQYGKSDAEVEEMSMDEYKEYIYGILDKIPYHPSQMRDIQFIDITEKGWEQMKNDPKYEAWVVGYFKVDRSVCIPFANYPGVEPSIHTEHFGASIEEHLGQSYPQSTSTRNEKDSEDWWKKRHKRHEQYMKQLEKEAEERRLTREENMSKAISRLMAFGGENTYFEFENNTLSAAASFFMLNTRASGGGI